jgi:hypothetical protein
VESVRKIADSAAGFASVTQHRNINNAGLANSLISGITTLCREYGKVIVVEDDIETAPHFLSFMNSALEKYQNEDQVGSISGYCYPVADQLPPAFFLRAFSSWGWAPWQRAGNIFEVDAKKLLRQLKAEKLTSEFDFYGSHHFTYMLRRQIWKRSDSWAIRWYASIFLQKKLTLFPGQSLVRNIGHDGTGIHSGATDAYISPLCTHQVQLADVDIVDNGCARKQFEQFFLKHEAMPLGALKYRIRAFVESTLSKLAGRNQSSD